MRAEQLTDPLAYHAEGPVWSPRWGGLRWLDMLAGDILSLDGQSQVGRTHVGDIVAAVRPRRDGGAVIGVERGFVLEGSEGELTRLPPLWQSGDTRMNEGSCDPDGRFYCGSMSYDQETPLGRLFRLDPDGSSSEVLDGITVSNGLDWSPDGSRAYYNDTPNRRIDVFDYDPDTGLHNRRCFARIPDAGMPDGLTVDADGGVWSAVFNHGVVQRFSPDGELDDIVEVPVRQVTACCFGGHDLGELYITTSREGLGDGEDPPAGSVFVARPGVAGLPVREFAG